MIFDKLQMFADDLAYNGTTTVIDLGAAGMGKGEPKKFFFQGHSLTEATPGDVTGIRIDMGATSSPTTDHVDFYCTLAQANAGFEFTLPAGTNDLRYCDISFLSTGPNGGTFTCGMVQVGQTNL